MSELSVNYEGFKEVKKNFKEAIEEINEELFKKCKQVGEKHNLTPEECQRLWENVRISIGNTSPNSFIDEEIAPEKSK